MNSTTFHKFYKILNKTFEKALDGSVIEKRAALKLLFSILYCRKDDGNKLIKTNIEIYKKFLTYCFDFDMMQVITIHSLLDDDIDIQYPKLNLE